MHIADMQFEYIKRQNLQKSVHRYTKYKYKYKIQNTKSAKPAHRYTKPRANGIYLWHHWSGQASDPRCPMSGRKCTP